MQPASGNDVVIRRRPPSGIGKHGCGPDFDFVVEGADTPINILEEIVWSKHTELEKVFHRDQYEARTENIPSV
jgi:indole-3-glycerol phosphate synthase